MATATPPPTVIDPTQPLQNKKYEALAQMVASGVPAYKSYVAVGFKAKTDSAAGTMASDILLRPDVNARLTYLRKGYDQAFAIEISRKVVSNITDRVERIKGYALRRQLLLELMAERAQDPQNQDIPGIRTGTLVVSMKLDAKGKVIQRDVKTDTGMLKSLLDIEKQASIELRQWVEQSSGIAPVDPREMTQEQLDKWLTYLAGLDPDGYKASAVAHGLPERVGDLIEAKASSEQSKPTLVDPLA